MSETTNPTLSGVSQTLLITLYLRAMETQRPDALIKDEKAVELVTRMSRDFDFMKQIPMKEVNKVVPLLRNRKFDRYAQDFLTRHPDGVVVHIGCGLDSRFERVAERNSKWSGMTWICRTSSSCAASSSAKNASAIISWPARRSWTPGWRL